MDFTDKVLVFGLIGIIVFFGYASFQAGENFKDECTKRGGKAMLPGKEFMTSGEGTTILCVDPKTKQLM